MHKLQNDTPDTSGEPIPSRHEVEMARERLARVHAEKQLEEKSRELDLANTTLKTVAEAVESQRVQLDTIFNYTLTGLALANDELLVTRANRKTISLFQLGEAYFAELTIPDLFEDYEDVATIYEKMVERGDGSHGILLETVGKRADGSTFPMEFGLTSMHINGKPHSVWVFSDISKRKREEDKRNALERELSQAHKMEALGILASGVAHEINTPIQYISDNLRFLEEAFDELMALAHEFEKLPERLEEGQNASLLFEKAKAKMEEIDLDFIREEGPSSITQSLEGIKQVASIVGAIKEFSHPGEDERMDFDLNQLVTTNLTVTRNQWKYIAEIETELSPDLPCLKGLPSDINQVLLNLIVNAADAIESKEDVKNGLIKIRTEDGGDHVVLEVTDNGCGMSGETAERIFNPFFTTKGVGKGTGQGLAIAYNIIKQKHGGSIHCASKPGAGTTFTIHLPYEQTPTKEA